MWKLLFIAIRRKEASWLVWKINSIKGSKYQSLKFYIKGSKLYTVSVSFRQADKWISAQFSCYSQCVGWLGPSRWTLTMEVYHSGSTFFLGEPSVLTLKDRMDPGWFRAVNTQSCPLECDCPIHWPTALYCDHRSLIQLPSGLPSRTQYLFLQGNNFTIIESGVFANATNLRWLILDHNRSESRITIEWATRWCVVLQSDPLGKSFHKW